MCAPQLPTLADVTRESASSVEQDGCRSGFPCIHHTSPHLHVDHRATGAAAARWTGHAFDMAGSVTSLLPLSACVLISLEDQRNYRQILKVTCHTGWARHWEAALLMAADVAAAGAGRMHIVVAA